MRAAYLVVDDGRHLALPVLYLGDEAQSLDADRRDRHSYSF